jgi:hypothetical protein
MKIVKILSLLAILFFVSCSKDESPKETNVEPDIQAYNSTYMHYNEPILVVSGTPVLNGEPIGVQPSFKSSNGNSMIKYDSSGKIIKRIGGFAPVPPSIGGNLSHVFSDDVTEDIIYNNDEIKITKNISNCNSCSFETKIKLDGKNRMVKKIVFNKASLFNDTILYTYSNLNLIGETLKIYGRSKGIGKTHDKAKYYYNQKQNLDSIVTYEYGDNFVSSEGIIKSVEISKSVEVFSNYDNAFNPLKKLIIFDETYFRAISKNNYAKYEKYIYKKFDKSEEINNSRYA